MARIQTDAMRAVLETYDRCELCGSRRELQAHHIIPLACGDISDLDVEENILCVCSKCHALLTPHSLLTKLGLKKAKENNPQLYQRKGRKLVTKKSKAIKDLIVKYNWSFDGKMSDVKTISIINMMDEIKTEDGEIIKPHIGETKSGKNMLNRYINRATFYKYKRELMGDYMKGEENESVFN